MVVALVLGAALFDWNWMRGPAERFASRSAGRTVSIGHLDVQFGGLTPRVVLSDVSLGNAAWAGPAPLARAKEVSFTVRLPSLFTHEVVVPHLRIFDGDVDFTRDAQGRANWRFRERDEPGRRNVRVLTIALDDARVSYRDAPHMLDADLHAVSRVDGRYATRIDFTGQWRNGRFAGTADTGDVLSLRGSSQRFPIRIVGTAGGTAIRAEGEVADITRLQHIDADFAIAGPSLASLYEALNVSLPDTPPYRARGRLKREGDVYSYENFAGTIGSTDVAGSARYELRTPRPLLTADLKSRALDLADLGPLIGARKGDERTGPAANAVNVDQQQRSRQREGRRPGSAPRSVLPHSEFNLEKLNRMDADVRLAADRLQVPGQLPLNEVAARAHLESGLLVLEPMNFGFAGGQVVSRIVLDARHQPLSGTLSADLKRVRIAQLFPTLATVKESSGVLGAQLRLQGKENSVAALLASSNGTVTAGMAGGRVSELAVWLVNLNGGELIPLLFGGDRPTPIRCVAAALDVKRGVGSLDLFVFDTEESRITGSGTIDLANERLDLVLRPEAKKPGLLSIRGPIQIQGPFSQVHFAIAPQSIARGLGAIALGIVNPVLALLPLVETGPGRDTDCRAVLEPVKGAVAQSGKSVNDAPGGESRGRSRQGGAVPQRDETTGQERQPPAPIVNAPPKK